MSPDPDDPIQEEPPRRHWSDRWIDNVLFAAGMLGLFLTAALAVFGLLGYPVGDMIVSGWEALW